jgi:hypothetical protein
MSVFRFGRSNIDLFSSKRMFFLLWLFLLVFPKGGFKVGEIPITWGYLLLELLFFLDACKLRGKIQHPRLGALLCIVPFQAISALPYFIMDFEHMHWAISFFISFFFLPYAFLLIFSNAIENMDSRFFLNLIRKGVVFVSYYGIFLFIYKQTTGEYFEIPFLTVNLADFGTLDATKCNSRGIVSKLISTYNNGQLFGISIIMLLPLYCYIQDNPWHKLAAKVALVLTLSRTAWLGLCFMRCFTACLS